MNSKHHLSAPGLLAACLALSACGGAGTEPQPTPDVFIALQRDFAEFEQWEPFSWEATESGPTHVPGPRTVYLNQRPPKDSTSFPVGTIIVKSITPPGAEEQLFAMAKRGGGFNEKGATGWEWFELKRSTSGAPVIVWRGVGAPAGHAYSAVDTGCNDCHRSAASNDFVLSPPLALQEL